MHGFNRVKKNCWTAGTGKRCCYFTADMTTFASFSIKCDPETIDELRATFPAVQEPSYFSKKHWCRVMMDGTISEQQLHEWLDISYDLVVAKLPKRIRDKINVE